MIGMCHFLYDFDSRKAAPAGDRDTGSWFYYYKWNVDDEVYIPVSSLYLSRFMEAKPGDFLWLAMDGWVLGGASIIRVEYELSQRRIELWYNAGAKRIMPERLIHYSAIGEVPPEVGARWKTLSD